MTTHPPQRYNQKEMVEQRRPDEALAPEGTGLSTQRGAVYLRGKKAPLVLPNAYSEAEIAKEKEQEREERDKEKKKLLEQKEKREARSVTHEEAPVQPKGQGSNQEPTLEQLMKEAMNEEEPMDVEQEENTICQELKADVAQKRKEKKKQTKLTPKEQQKPEAKERITCLTPQELEAPKDALLLCLESERYYRKSLEGETEALQMSLQSAYEQLEEAQKEATKTAATLPLLNAEDDLDEEQENVILGLQPMPLLEVSNPPPAGAKNAKEDTKNPQQTEGESDTSSASNTTITSIILTPMKKTFRRFARSSYSINHEKAINELQEEFARHRVGISLQGNPLWTSILNHLKTTE